MKYTYIFFTFLFFTNCFSQESTINKQVEFFKSLVIEKKFEELSNYASPKLIAHLSSKKDVEFLISGLSDNISNMNAEISNITFGNNSKIFRENEELQCSIPLEIELKNSDRKV